MPYTDPEAEPDPESNPDSEPEPESSVNSWLYTPDWSSIIYLCNQAEECTGVYCYNVKY